MVDANARDSSRAFGMFPHALAPAGHGKGGLAAEIGLFSAVMFV